MTYPDDFINKVICGDCLEIMKHIPDGAVDMILCDLPYGVTKCDWDNILPIKEIWKLYRRIIKNNGVILLTATQPFASMLINGNIKDFKYEWIWNKKIPANMATCKKQPLRQHEQILVFYKKQCLYNPIMNPKETVTCFSKKKIAKKSESMGDMGIKYKQHLGYPKTILTYRRGNNLDRDGYLHPTQKPIKLFSYLIKTYTNKNDIILDNCLGSGTTAVACKQLGRRFIGEELFK